VALPSLTPVLAFAAAGAILVLTPSAVPSEQAATPDRRIVAETGGFGPEGFQRLATSLSFADRALAGRLDLVAHPDPWDRPAAWASLDLDDPPSLPLKALDQKQASKINAVMPNLGEPPTPAPSFVLTGRPAERARAELCMAQAIYYEAALEPTEGQQAVAQTILNRVRHPDFPKTVCGVVYEGASAPGCQFSFACDGSRDRPPIEPYWSQAKQMAAVALRGWVDKAVGSATYYHATYVFPGWGPQMVRIGQFGSQVFYRYPGPSGEVSALGGRYGGGELAVSLAGPPHQKLKDARSDRQRNEPPAPAGVIMARDTSQPGHARVRGELMFGRYIPTKEEIAEINAEVAALTARVPTTTLEPPPPNNPKM
jgi:spore germination cell wall hydrolase CwlJ-like protein